MAVGRAPVGMTPRRVLRIVEQLPEGSAFHASVKGGLEHRSWTADRILLAGIFNALQGANYQRGGGKGRKPKAVEPPEVRKADRRKSRRARTADRLRRGVAAARSVVVPDPPSAPPEAPAVQRGGLGVPSKS